MKAYVCDGKVFVYDEDGRWVTINGRHVFIKERLKKPINGYMPSVIKKVKDKIDNAVDVIIDKYNLTRPKHIFTSDGYGKRVMVGRGKPMTHEEADSGKVNPHFYIKTINAGLENENCQSCVVAYEMRLRGYNVQARKYSNQLQRRVSDNMEECWKTIRGKIPKSVKFPKNNPIDFLEKHTKTGRRYCLEMRWLKDAGHIVSVSKNKDGNLVIYDGQDNTIYTGKDNIAKAFSNGKYFTKLLRIDNLKLNPKYSDSLIEITDKKRRKK